MNKQKQTYVNRYRDQAGGCLMREGLGEKVKGLQTTSWQLKGSRGGKVQHGQHSH